MSKFLATAAAVVGAVALVVAVPGVGAGIAAAIGTSAGTVTSVAAIAAATLSVGATVLKPKPSEGGAQEAWKADPNAGIPYAIGRTYIGGNIVYRRAWGKDNVYQTLITVLSGAGPHQSIDQIFVDKVPRSINGQGIVNIPNYGFMFAGRQLGATPTPAALTSQPGTPSGWTAESRLSGFAASTVTLKYDTKGDNTLTSTPDIGWVGHWAKVYDPRRDSTYPGGSGAHRIANEATWEWSENPYLHALTWLIGRRQNGKLVLGVGVNTVSLITEQFVEGANVADANGWKIGGVVYSTDDKWNVYKQMLQAGGGEPLRLGAQIGCLVNTPRVALATIGTGDVIGEASVQATQSRRDRINAIIPRYRSEANEWSVVAGSPVVVPEYVAFDGRQRQREVEYSLVQSLKQSQELARYDIENAREFGPINLPLKLRWMGYRPGDVVRVELPELGLVAQDVLLLTRSLSPQDGTVTMTARSETAGKHPYALGQTGTPPETPGVTGPLLTPTPGPAAWAITGTSIESDGVTVPALVITGAVDSTLPDVVSFEYRPFLSGQGLEDGWIGAGNDAPTITQKVISSVESAAAYEVSVSYRSRSQRGGRLILGPVMTGAYDGLGGGAPGLPGSGAWTHVSNNPGAGAVAEPTRAYTTGPVQDWGVYATQSIESYRDGMVASWTLPPLHGDRLHVGVSTHPASGLSYQRATFAFSRESDGTIATWVEGVQRTAIGTFTDGVTMQIEYDGRVLRWVLNGQIVDSLIWLVNDALFFVTALNGQDPRAENIAFAKAGRASTALIAYLTNETFSVPTDANGNYGTFPQVLSQGQMKVFAGGADVTSQCLFTAQNPAQLDARINSDGTYYAVGLYDNSGYSFLLASYNGAAVQKTLSASKVRGGEAATDITVTASEQAIRYNNADQIVSGPITITTARKNTAVDPFFNLVSFDGFDHGKRTAQNWRATFPAIFSGSGPDQLIISQGWIDGIMQTRGGGLRVFAEIPGVVTDIVSLVKIKDGANGTDGFIVDTEHTEFLQPVFSSGASKPTWYGGQGTIRLMKGGQRLTGGVTYGVRAVTNIASLTLSGDTFGFAGTNAAEGSFIVQAFYNGQTYERTITVKKVYDGEAAFRGSTAFSAQQAGGGVVALGNGTTTVPGGRGCTLSAVVNYSPFNTVVGSYRGRLYLYWRNATDAGPLNLLGSVDGSTATTINQGTTAEPDLVFTPGTVSASFSFAAPPTDKQIYFEARLERIAGNLTVGLDGSMKLEVSS